MDVRKRGVGRFRRDVRSESNRRQTLGRLLRASSSLPLLSPALLHGETSCENAESSECLSAFGVEGGVLKSDKQNGREGIDAAGQIRKLEKYKKLLYKDEVARAELAEHIREGGFDKFKALLKVDPNLARLTESIATTEIGVPFLMIEGLKSGGVTPENVELMMYILEQVHRANPTVFQDKVRGFFSAQSDRKMNFIDYAAKVLDPDEFAVLQPQLKKFIAKDRLGGNKKLVVLLDDITTLPVDVVVNAAKCSLDGGSGVDGSIHAAAGPRLKKEATALAPCAIGDVKSTDSYRMRNCKRIYHTVGPLGVAKGRRENLRNCYWNSLELLKKEQLRSIAFPCISTGAFSYPVHEAAEVAVRTVEEWLSIPGNSDAIDKIAFTCFFGDTANMLEYRRLIPDLFVDDK